MVVVETKEVLITFLKSTKVIKNNNLDLFLPSFMNLSLFLHSRYHGHVPNVAYSFGDTYGNATMKYFQDSRNAAMKTSCSPYSKGGQFPTLFSPDPDLVIGARARGWDRWLHTPNYSRFNLDFNRSAELKEFYKVSQSLLKRPLV